MLYTTNISTALISETELDALLETLKKFTGKEIQVQKTFVISTEDVNITTMLDALKDALVPVKTAKSNGHKKVAKASEMTSHQVKIEPSGEIMSRQKFNKLLADSFYGNGVVVVNSKAERFVVMDRELVKEPQS